ncbi:MAG: hypothetical protein ACFFD4_33285 [Candidatus Odinarchaeota archaeon]
MVEPLTSSRSPWESDYIGSKDTSVYNLTQSLTVERLNIRAKRTVRLKVSRWISAVDHGQVERAVPDRYPAVITWLLRSSAWLLYKCSVFPDTRLQAAFLFLLAVADKSQGLLVGKQ